MQHDMDVQSDHLVGQLLDEYRIENPLGHGGMARVYRAFDTKLHRNVALKVIAPDFREHEQFTQRFEHEARSIARLEHPNIVHIYRFGEANGLFYMAMQYIDGVDLAWLIKDYRHSSEIVPIDDQLRIIDQVGQALDYAHRRGVIHRDVKPGNIMIDTDGRAILTDFGIALPTSEQSQVEASGSPAYIAPEQVVESGHVVPQSDLYSLGISLFQMLTGELPFRGASPSEIALCQVTEQPPRPGELNVIVPPAVDAVVLRSLSKDPQHRYPGGMAFSAAFQEAAAGWTNAVAVTNARLLSSVTVAEKVRSRNQPTPAAIPREALLGPTEPDILPESAPQAALPIPTDSSALPAIPEPGTPAGHVQQPYYPRAAAPRLNRRQLSSLTFTAGLLAIACGVLVCAVAGLLLITGPRKVAVVPTLQPSATGAPTETSAPTMTAYPTELPPTAVVLPSSFAPVEPTALPTAVILVATRAGPTIAPPADRSTVPAGSLRLGEFTVEWYCNEQNYGVMLVNNQSDWACTRGNSVAFTLTAQDFDNICRAVYGDSSAFAIQDQRKPQAAYNWSCFTYSVSGRTRLGEFQVEPYCNDRGLGIILVNQQSDWACTNQSTGAVVQVLTKQDFDAICRQRYNDPHAFAVRDQQKAIAAYNWSCYTAP